MPEILEDDRLGQVLSDFDKRYTGSSYAAKKENANVVTVEMLPEVSSIML
jgi:hypothetical protein